MVRYADSFKNNSLFSLVEELRSCMLHGCSQKQEKINLCFKYITGMSYKPDMSFDQVATFFLNKSKNLLKKY